MSINIDEYYSSRELIVGCLAVNGKYVMHFQDENKLSNVWTMYKNDGEMGKRLLTATVKVWRVWQGRQMLYFVAATTSKLLLEIYV